MSERRDISDGAAIAIVALMVALLAHTLITGCHIRSLQHRIGELEQRVR